MALLDEDDKLFLDRICSVSRLDKSVVIEVLNSILNVAVVEIYAERNEITIPMICKLKIDYHDVVQGGKGVLTQVDLEATAKKGLISEINCISEGEETTTQKYFKEDIKNKFRMTVELE